MSDALEKYRTRSKWVCTIAELREIENDPEATETERVEAKKSADGRIRGGQAVADRILKDRQERIEKGWGPR